MHLSDVRKVTIDQGDADDPALAITHGPGLFGARGLDIFIVGLGLPEPFGDGRKQTRDVLRDLHIPKSAPAFLAHATFSGVIAVILSRSALRSSRSS